MVRTELSDVRDGLVRRIDHPQSENEIEVFRRPIGFRGVPERLITQCRKFREGGLIGAQLDFFFRETRCEFSQKLGRDGAMHEHGLDRIADAGPLRLGVRHDLHRHVEVGFAVDVNDADAIGVFDHRHAGARRPRLRSKPFRRGEQ